MGFSPDRSFPYMLCFSFSLKNLDSNIWCPFPELFCCCWCSVAQSCPTLWDPMDCSMPGFSVLHYLVHWVGDAHHILCHPLLFLLSIFPSIRIFSSESAFPIRWPKYWSFISASILPMNIQGWCPLELTGSMSLQSEGLSRVFPNPTIWKHRFFGAWPSLWSSFP